MRELYSPSELRKRLQCLITDSLHLQEFEIIAQIKLFQGAAKNYAITHDDEFRLWFDNIKTFSEGERFVGARFGLNE